jgi:DHA1 family putative efflux transporter-like MFS transporter
MWAAIALLAFGTFIVGTSELGIAGILPVIATDLNVSIAAAGYLVTAYALSFALVTPIVAATTGRFARKPMLVVCMAIFVVGNGLAVLAPNFAWLIVARVISAVASGVFEVIATAAAAALVPVHQRGRAIALVVGGFSVALLVGVPLGTLVGLAFGWRATFGALLVLGVLAVLGVLFLLPNVPGAEELSNSSVLRLLARRDIVVALGATALTFTGIYVATTYIAAFLEDVSLLPPQAVAGVLLLLGLGSVVGNIIGGHGSDRWGMPPILFSSSVAMALGLAGVSLLGPIAMGVIGAFAVFGTATGVWVPVQQARIVALAPESPEFALAANLAALNLGIALGAALGSGVVDRGGLAIVGYLGAGIVVLAIGLQASTTSRV